MLLSSNKLESNSFDEFAEVLKNGSIENIQLGRGGFKAQLGHIVTPNVVSSHFFYNQRIIQKGVSLPGYITFMFWNPNSSLVWRYHDLRFGALPVIWKNEHHCISGDNFEGMPVSINANYFILECHKRGYGRLIKDLESKHLFQVSNRHLDRVRFFLRSAHNKEWQSHEFESILIELVLDCFESYCIEENTPKLKMRSIINFICENTETINSVQEITSEFNITDRTLRNNFKRELDISPKKFIQAIKLNEVYKNLKISNQQSSIKSTASIQGYWHMSQFSKDFKSQFAILPSDLK